jgi:hypothetical protein
MQALKDLQMKLSVNQASIQLIDVAPKELTEIPRENASTIQNSPSTPQQLEDALTIL